VSSEGEQLTNWLTSSERCASVEWLPIVSRSGVGEAMADSLQEKLHIAEGVLPPPGIGFVNESAFDSPWMPSALGVGNPHGTIPQRRDQFGPLRGHPQLLRGEGMQISSSKVTSSFLRARSIRALAAMSVACLLLVPMTPAAADHPGGDPSYVGELRAVATADQVECWVGEEAIDHEAEIWFLFWKAIECPDYDEDEVEETNNNWGTVYAPGSWTAHINSRVERFEGGTVKTGADTMSRRYGYANAVPAGWLVNFSELWASDGYSWWSCRQSGFNYSWYTTHLHVPTFNWGFAPCGQARWYANWSGGYQWTGSSWNSNWRWSGTVYVPCIFCLTAADSPTEPPALPDAGTKPRTPRAPKVKDKA